MPKLLLLLLLFNSIHCAGQDQNVGGPCEGCEALLEYGNRSLQTTDTLPYFDGTKSPLILSGTVFEPDGQTPAPNVIIYAYHTDEKGIYVSKDDSKGWEQRHGSLRGWVKTGPDGSYQFFTNRPGVYPSRQAPEHIHLTVKEPGMIPYYIDAIQFLDDPLLSESIKSGMKSRGGSGLVSPVLSEGTWKIRRDIVLGRNIPDHPNK
jgi:protocatechuate 3,4-dioxygenase beta subunit